MNHKDHHPGLDAEAGFVQVLNPEAARAFGAAMRKAREDAGITAERAAIVTRISPAFILALESGDFKKLPGLVFARGFVRNLCKPYRINAATMIELFDLALHSSTDGAPQHSEVAQGVEEEVEVAETGRARTPFNASRAFAVSARLMAFGKSLLPLCATHKRKLTWGAGGLAVVVVLALVATQVPSGDADREIVAAVAPSPAEEAPAPVLVDNTNEALPSQELTTASEPAPAASEPSSSKTPVVNEPVAAKPVAAATPKVVDVAKPEKVEKPVVRRDASEKHVLNVGLKPDGAVTGPQKLEIIAKNQVVVRFAKDGGGFETRTLEPRSHSFEFLNEAQLLIFDAAAVDVKFNGRSLGSLGNRGRVRRISFRKEDLANDKKL